MRSEKVIKLGINGFGRIGRCFMRAHSKLPPEIKKKIPIVVINSGTDNPADLSHLLKYDSTHGVWDKEIKIGSKFFNYGDGDIHTIKYSNPSDTPWNDYGVSVVIESSGQFNTISDSIKHFGEFNSKNLDFVIVTAPCDGAKNNIIFGVNEDLLEKIMKREEGLENKIISIGSCTTNCLAPIVYALNNEIGIEKGFMTTIHAYTNDQQLLDSRHKDKRRARSAAASMIPASTGAAKMIGSIIPSLNGRLDGTAVRVPVMNVSLVDLKFVSKINVTESKVNEIMRKAAVRYPNVIKINEEELVSVDFNSTSYSAVFDVTQTKVVQGNFCRVAAWYDNEFGFVNRILDLVQKISENL